MKRTAKAHWSGTLKEGKGSLTAESGILRETNYSYKTRFEEGSSGTNPEELLAAAHAGCFTMAVASAITKKGITPDSLDTEASITMEGLDITASHLKISGKVPGMSEKDFIEITEEMAKGCMVSKALSIKITSEAHFIS